jgi:hypothetical protein
MELCHLTIHGVNIRTVVVCLWCDEGFVKELEVRREVEERGEGGGREGARGEERREKQSDIVIVVKPTSTTITPNFRQTLIRYSPAIAYAGPVCDLPLLFASPPPHYYVLRQEHIHCDSRHLPDSSRCLFLLYLSAIKALQFGHSLNLPRWRFCLVLLALGCWLFGVVCRFVDIDGGHC